MQQIESDEILDTGLGLIRNGVPERTLKFDLGRAFSWEKMMMLSTREGGSNVDGDGCSERAMSLCSMTAGET